MSAEERQTPVERMVERSRLDDTGVGRPLSRRTEQYQRSLEAYLKAGNRPRWMARLAEIEQGAKDAERRLADAYERLRGEEPDPARFAARWREIAERWDFAELNELIGQHNEWYPIERQLPANPRTGDYVLVNGRSYRWPVLDAAWVLERFGA